MSSRSRELAAALVRTQGRVRAAEKSLQRFVARHETVDARTMKSHRQRLADLLLARNDLEVIERMMDRENDRALKELKGFISEAEAM